MADGTWIGWFVELQVNSFLCRVPHNYAQDMFNLTGLELLVPDFMQNLCVILDTDFNTGFCQKPIQSDPEQCAQLYGLIHARYILTTRGVDDMCVKYERGDFGRCPRIFCNGQLVLPVGLSDRIGESQVKVYCPRCRDVYKPHSRHAQLDGAMFGSSFPHMFFMQLPHLLPEQPVMKYTPRLYGFKVHSSALFPPDSKPIEDPNSNGNKQNEGNDNSNNNDQNSSGNNIIEDNQADNGSKANPSTSVAEADEKGDSVKIRPPTRRFDFSFNGMRGSTH